MLATVMVGTLLVGLDRTIVNLAVVPIIGEFDLSIPEAGWLATAYIIADSVFIPVFGKLGDMIGDRRVHLIGLSGFLVTSLLCGLAPTFGVLVFFRVLQGLLGAAVFPTALALITRAFEDPAQRNQAFGVWSASFAMSLALGPLLGGPLIDNLSWRWIFYINFPLSVLGIVMLQRFISKDERPGRLRAFDWQGAVLLGLALGPLVLVLERGRIWGWESAGAVLCYVTAVVCAIWFVAFERGHRDPMIKLSLFRNRVLSASLAVSFISFVGMVGTMFLGPVFTQQMLGYNATQSGLILLPLAFTLMVVAPVAVKLLEGVPPRVTIGAGLLLAAVGTAMLTDLDIKSSSIDMILPLVVMAVGLAIGFAPLTTAATVTVPPRDIGMASGILNLVRNIGAAVGIALFATLLDLGAEDNIIDLSAGSVVDQPDPALRSILPQLIVAKAQVDSYDHVFGLAAVTLALAAVCAWSLGKVRLDTATAERASEGGAHA